MSDNLVAVIAQEEIGQAFEIFGFKIFSLQNANELKDKIILAEQENYSIIFIQEDLILGKEECLGLYREEIYPILIPFSTHKESPNLLKKLLQSNSIRAIGADIIGVKQ